MNTSLNAIASTFCVSAAVLGIPSFALTLLYCVYRIQLLLAPAPSSSGFPKNPDAILLMLEGMTRAINAAASVFGSLGQYVFGILASLALLVLLFSASLYFTGRGLQAHQTWARGVAGLLMFGLLIVSLAALVSIRGPFQVLSLTIASASTYALWALWRGFSA